jgi:hypothetical protein
MEALRRDISVREARVWMRRHAVALWMVVGALLRIQTYLAGRSYWMDENSLAGNLKGVSPWTAPSPLIAAQLAPYGFLVVERLLGLIDGGSRWTLRLLPLIASLVSLPLFACVMRRALPRRAWVATASLFALSDSMIYFGSELKPYGLDATAALAIWALPADWSRSWRRAASIAALGAGLVWLSFPAAIMLVGVGVVEVAEALRRANRRRLTVAAGIGGVWAVSLAGSQWAASRLLDEPGTMQVFWNFAFPPAQAGLGAVVAWFGARWVNLFSNPMRFELPWLGGSASALVGAVLAGVGMVQMGQRRGVELARLMAPVVLAAGLAFLRIYPFHGRLIVWLVPALFLWVGSGLGWLMSHIPPGPLARQLILAVVLACPLWLVGVRLIEPEHRTYSPFGDLRPNPFLLDVIERHPFLNNERR